MRREECGVTFLDHVFLRSKFSRMNDDFCKNTIRTRNKTGTFHCSTGAPDMHCRSRSCKLSDWWSSFIEPFSESYVLTIATLCIFVINIRAIIKSFKMNCDHRFSEKLFLSQRQKQISHLQNVSTYITPINAADKQNASTTDEEAERQRRSYITSTIPHLI